MSSKPEAAEAKAESEQINDSINETEIKKFNNFVTSIIPSIRKNKKWLGNKNMCEICGMSVATVNLDLTAGTHRECRYCWDYN